ncbi:MAG: hypothetical protein IGR80_16555 [Synechococcales cyanobacterium K44_A2020_017]|nr:hypothetical protein [Synechococcales cyanobacterium K32_A2020_035]MBF2096350.1 hypothetical protein [Synechococcales cyanobacterium K44_A2020_017]
MTTIKPANVKTYPQLQELAQHLCEKDNHVDGILVLCPRNHDNQFFLTTYAPEKIQGIDVEAFGGSLLGVLKTAEDLVLSESGFETGDTRTIIYEFNSLIFVIYSVRGENLQDVYLVLLNATEADLGAFNANRNQVRAQMEVAIKGLMKQGMNI